MQYILNEVVIFFMHIIYTEVSFNFVGVNFRGLAVTETLVDT